MWGALIVFPDGERSVSHPIQVSEHADWVMVSGGGIGIREDGSGARTLWIKGSGAIGEGNTPDLPTSVQVGTGTDWLMVSVGDAHTMGIRGVAGGERTLWGWGNRLHGRLGDGFWATSVQPGQPTPHQATPVQITSFTDWVTVSAGGQHTMGIREDAGGNRTLWAWGYRADGRLGVGAADAFAQGTPAQVGGASGHTDWLTVSAGGRHTMGIRGVTGGTGTLWAWGDHWLSAGVAPGDRATPSQVGAHSDWLTVSAGASHTMGIREVAGGTGTLWAWGSRLYGQLGDGAVTNIIQGTPIQVGAAADWATVSAGFAHTMGIRGADNGQRTLWAWGRHRLGADTAAPVQVGAPQQ